MKRMRYGMVVALLLVVTLGGCAKQEAVKTEGSVAASADDAGKPVDIWWAERGETGVSPKWDQMIDDVAKAELKERFNVNLRKDTISPSNYGEKLNVLIASGKYPEIVSIMGLSNFAEAVKSGFILPVTDIFETDENWKHMDKSIMQAVTYGGEIYGLYDVVDLPDGIYLREDWLDNLGLAQPKSADELYQVLKAFTENDPDGDGKMDTIGLAISSKFDECAPFWKLFLPANPFTVDAGFFYDEASGQVRHITDVREDLVAALSWFRNLYQEGILDREFVVSDKTQAENKFLAGSVGAWPKGVLWITKRQGKLEKNVPTGRIMSLPAIQTKYGTNYDRPAGGNGWAITNAAKGKEEIAKQVLAYLTGPDFVLPNLIGREGIEYTVEDGTIHWKDDAYQSGYNTGMVLASPFDVSLPVPDPLLEKSVAAADGMHFKKVLPWGESATYLKNGADYEKIMMEGFTKIIIGEQPISYVDTIIKDVRALDVQTACAEITALMN